MNEILADTICAKDKKIISFGNFCQLLQRIISDDEKHFPINLAEDADESMDFKVRVTNKNDLLLSTNKKICH